MGTLIAYQGILDSPKYPILWVDDKILPPTHDDVDAIIFADHSSSAMDLLDKPLGQIEETVKKKTLVFTPANIRENTR
jgi:hypothetical protein